MSNTKILLGQFLASRLRNPDTANDPYDPTTESALEDPRLLPNPGLVAATPSPLPPPPAVQLSSPAGLPAPLSVTLGSPADLPQPPVVVVSNPSILPSPPPVTIHSPAVLPPPPPVIEADPAVLPPPPPVQSAVPQVLPPPPPVVQSQPATLPAPPPFSPESPDVLPVPPPFSPESPDQLPPPPPVVLSAPADLPEPPPVNTAVPTVLPDPPAAVLAQPSQLPPPPDFSPAIGLPVDPNVVNPQPTIDSGYFKFFSPEDPYSPIFGGADAGSLAADPVLYARHLERLKRLPPGKLVAHSLVQVGLWAQNVYGNVWNPAMLAPPPVGQSFMPPALDLFTSADEIKQMQLGQKVFVDAALDGTPVDPNFRFSVTVGQGKVGTEPTVTTITPSGRLTRAFQNIKQKNPLGAVNSLMGIDTVEDPLFKSKLAFENGVIPMRLKGDNNYGFRTFKRGQGDQTDDDSVYVPLSFTDLRPIGDTFRTVYFRPLITGLAEDFMAEWNKGSYFGRVDPVASYQGTTRTITLSFKLVAFGPEDVKTIYQKIHWLGSMVYPEYDSNLMYKSGPVTRLRVGDVINGLGPEGGRGLAGIIESLSFDYAEALWELKKGWKVPRNVDVSLTFTVLHDTPIGRGADGQFGGLGLINDEGEYEVAKTAPGVGQGSEEGDVFIDPSGFRHFGAGDTLLYSSLNNSDKE